WDCAWAVAVNAPSTAQSVANCKTFKDVSCIVSSCLFSRVPQIQRLSSRSVCCQIIRPEVGPHYFRLLILASLMVCFSISFSWFAQNIPPSQKFCQVNYIIIEPIILPDPQRSREMVGRRGLEQLTEQERRGSGRLSDCSKLSSLREKISRSA